jgi:sodium transport system permease protein
MRWPVVRLIAARETRDLLRDRRTVMLILVLPAVLYPLFGGAAFLFALSLAGQTTTVGVSGYAHLTPPDPAGKTPFPPLLDGEAFVKYTTPDEDTQTPTDRPVPTGPVRVVRLDGDAAEALDRKQVDAVVEIPPDLFAGRPGDRPQVRVRTRDGDERSKLAGRRAADLLRRWQREVKQVTFRRAGLPDDFDQPFRVLDPLADKTKEKKTAVELRDLFVKTFPFLLLMWLVAGAVQPAVDLTAGEKERGTMETLLISPAERTEIVAGKFLAATFFAFAPVVWNVLWLTAGAVGFGLLLGERLVYLPGLLGCLLLGVPLAMLFSAVALALGVFARSTKEGQYYLMPLLLVSMPLALYTLDPAAELTPTNAWVPVTGAMLLQQKLLAVSGDPVPWTLFAPVLGSLTASVVVALGAAVWQFRREAVLFRELGTK